MKKRILLVALLIALFVCAFAISASAETPSMYIEFGARFPGSDEYIIVYTENAESKGNPQINFETKKFYSDVNFTTEVDMSTATGIDFSVAKSYVDGVQGNAITRMARATEPFVNCVEVKWFLEGMPTISYNSAFTFKDWTGLKYFDFGNATAIGDNVFQNTGFETLTIPATITKINGSSFKECVSLKSVKFEGGLNSTGNGSIFYGCTALETVDLGSATSLGNSTFRGCTSLTSITIPSTVTSIGSNVFYDCTSLETVVAPSVKSIGDNAFKNCKALTNITTTSVLTSIGQETFRYCEKLEGSFDFSSIKTLKSHAFGGCTVLKLGNVNLAELTSLGGGAFSGCLDLTSIVIPEGITAVGGFKGCTNLKSIKLPSTIVSLSGNAFEECTSLTNVEFTYNYEKYPEHGSAFTTVSNGSVFKNCTSLTTLVFPNSLTHVDNAAFSGCTGLKTLVLGASFATTNQNPAIPKSVTSLVLTENYKMNGTLFSGSDSKFTFPTSFVIYYTGTLEEAQALQAINTSCWEVSHSTLVSYDEFISESFVRDDSIHYFVYNYSKCTAFYNDVHIEKVEDNNACYLKDCSRCVYHDRYVGNNNTHIMETTYAYANYFANGTITSACQNEGCIYHGEGNAHVDNETLLPIFTSILYSTKEDGASFGIYVEYSVDQKAVANYKSVTGKTLNYGVVAIANKNLKGNGPLNVDGSTEATNVIAADVTDEALNTVRLIVTGNWSDNASVAINMLGYITNGEELQYVGIKTTTVDDVTTKSASTSISASALNAVVYENLPKETEGDVA